MSTPIPLPRLGIDLLSDETQMPAGTVRAAINVDIDKRGQFARRQGTALATAGNGYDDLRTWGNVLLARKGASLISIDPDTLAEALLCDLGGDDRIDYADYNGNLYAAAPNGLWLLRDGMAQLAGSRLPDSLPLVEPATAGALTKCATSLVQVS